jgi:hypothetical protein
MSNTSIAKVPNRNLGCSTSSPGAHSDGYLRFAAVEEISERLATDILELDPVNDETPPSPSRVKTRILNFGFGRRPEPEAPEKDEVKESPAVEKLPIGWVAVINGPGRGNFFPLSDRVSQIGRAEGQAIQLGFGDDYISRESHAAILYAPDRREFELHDSGKANPVRLNNQKVTGAQILRSGDTIQVGTTTLRFLALCDADFAWETSEG